VRSNEKSEATGATRCITEFVRDLRLGAVVLRRSPGFSTLAIITLGVALGLSALTFSIIDGILIKPLPYRTPIDWSALLGR